MELKIYSPSEDGFIKAIDWNHEELKKEIAEKISYYSKLVYTDEQIKDAKADRAKLNKFVAALETKRKEVKKQCLAPYEDFEKQIKEIIAIVNEPILMIDGKVKGYEEQEKAKKQMAIEAYFEGRNPFDWLSLKQIFNEKWLNVSVKMPKVTVEIDSAIEQIEKDLATLSNLLEFSFEATEEYKHSLDLNKAIAEGSRLSEIQKRKAEQQQKMNEAFEKMKTAAETVTENIAKTMEAVNDAQTQKQWISFKAHLTVDDATELRKFFNSRNIEFEAIN